MVYEVETNITLTNEIIDWCKEQYAAYAHNQTISGLWVIVIALISQLLIIAITNNADKIIERSQITEGDLIRIYKILQNFTFLLMAGFVIWNLFLT